jgi:hypothetical protein
MNLYVRTLSCLALLGTSLVALSQYRPSWAAELNLDWWNLPELREDIRREKEREGKLRRDTGIARCAAREEVTQDLLAGRLTLPQAAARFRALNAAVGPNVPPLGLWFPGATEEERLCRQVIAWVESASTVPRSPGSGRTARRRLVAELTALLDQGHGVIRLPE